ALDGERYLALVAALEAFIAEPPFSEPAAVPAADEVPVLVRKAGKRMRRAVKALQAMDEVEPAGIVGTSAAAARAARDHQLHRIRITAKRLRYIAEAVTPVAGSDAKALAKVAEQIQETLGNHQDAVVQRQWLRDLGARAFLNGEN